jgi:hypothetical protein
MDAFQASKSAAQVRLEPGNVTARNLTLVPTA